MNRLPIWFREGLRTLSSALAAGAICALACGLVGACGDTTESLGLKIVNPQNRDRDYDWDLGRVPYGEVAECTVKLQNQSTRPIKILQVTAGCSCTVPSISYTAANGEVVKGHMFEPDGPVLELPPKAIADLHLRVDTRIVPARNTPKRVIVVIRTDSPATPFPQLEVHLVVELPWQVVPAVVQLGEVPVNVGAAGSADVVCISQHGEQILGILTAPKEFDCELSQLPNAPGVGWKLSFRWQPPVRLGTVNATVVLLTSGPGGQGEGRPLDVQIAGIGVPDLGTTPTSLVFGGPSGENADVAAVEVFTRVPGQRLLVREARIEGDEKASLSAVVTPLEPDELGRSVRWRVELHCDRSLGAKAFGGALVLVLDDPTTPELSVPYMSAARS